MKDLIIGFIKYILSFLESKQTEKQKETAEAKQRNVLNEQLIKIEDDIRLAIAQDKDVGELWIQKKAILEKIRSLSLKICIIVSSLFVCQSCVWWQKPIEIIPTKPEVVIINSSTNEATKPIPSTINSDNVKVVLDSDVPLKIDVEQVIPFDSYFVTKVEFLTLMDKETIIGTLVKKGDKSLGKGYILSSKLVDVVDGNKIKLRGN